MKKSKKVNRAWLNDHVNDPYGKLAKREGYRARAAYKLKEIDEAFGLVKPGHVVVDLGSAPGAWSQYLRRRLSPRTAIGGGAAAGPNAVASLRAAQAEDARVWVSQGALNPHSAAHFGRYLFKPVGPLAFVDEGINPYAGSSVYLEAHVQTPARARPADGCPVASRPAASGPR